MASDEDDKTEETTTETTPEVEKDTTADAATGVEEEATETGESAAEEKKDDEEKKEEKAATEDNKDEDVKIEDGEEGTKTDSNETSGARKTSKSASENEELLEAEPELKKSDYSLMDSLTGFLYEDSDPLPILCGYFLKIMDQLLNK